VRKEKECDIGECRENVMGTKKHKKNKTKKKPSKSHQKAIKKSSKSHQKVLKKPSKSHQNGPFFFSHVLALVLVDDTQPEDDLWDVREGRRKAQHAGKGGFGVLGT
jgi:hypothetical protein